MLSSRVATSCARSIRVPTGSSAVTLTSPSSACGISSKPIVGRIKTAATTAAAPIAEHRRPVHERLVDDPAVAVVHAGEEPFAPRVQASDHAVALLGRRRQLQHPRAQHRHDRDGDKQRHRQREHHDDRELLEEDARHAGQEQQRNEDRDVRQRRRQDRRPDFLRTLRSTPCIRSLPCSMCRKVFSMTTIEASTIMPMPSARPPKVIVFSV